MRFADQFRKWRRNSNQRDIASMMENNHIYEETTTAVIGADLPPPPPKNEQQNGSKKLRKQPTKQYPPSPDSYLNGIGDYTFIKQVGQGKFSRVMLSYHCLTRKQVAVKIIDKRVHDYRVMSRLVREISLMEVLDHPNIVRLYETYETTDSLYLVMEYVDGYNLDEYLQQKGGKLNENKARDIFRQMAAAMDYCHSKWVVHRDLKAPNILLTKDFKVKIADFGLGNRFGRRRLKTICGSMLYYSPEIINGQGYTGPEVDCWCLGVSLYRMTVGEEPFSRANTVGDLRKDVTAGQYVIPSHLSSGLKSAIMKCMSVDKNKRTRVHMALKDDPWLFNQGQLPNIFSTTTTSTPAVMTAVILSKDDELTRQKKEKEILKYQYMRDMEEEKRSKKLIKRTIICHPKNPSIYFTSAVPHSSKAEDTFTNSETQRHLLFQKMNEFSRQIQLSSTQNAAGKSPIKHLLRKLKQPEAATADGSLRRNSYNILANTAAGSNNNTEAAANTIGGGPPGGRTIVRKSTSNMSLSQLYQRVTKDQVHYYTFQLTPQIAALHFSSLPAQQDEFTMMLIIRGICDIMGITYHRDKNDHLICVMALSDYINEKPSSSNNNKSSSNSFYKLKRRDSKMNTSNPSLYYNNSNTTTGGASSSQASFRQSDMNRSSYFVNSPNGIGGGSSRFSKFKRMTSHVLSSIFPYNSSTLVVHHTENATASRSVRYPPFPTPINTTNRTSASSSAAAAQQQQTTPTTPSPTTPSPTDQQQQQQQEESEENKKSGIAIFAIEIISLTKDTSVQQQHITAIKFSKLDGSSKVFRIACGWLTGVIGQQNITPAQLTSDNMLAHLLTTAAAVGGGSSTDIPHHPTMYAQQQQKRLSRPKSNLTLLPIAAAAAAEATASSHTLTNPHPLDSPPSSSGQFIVDDQQQHSQKKVVSSS